MEQDCFGGLILYSELPVFLLFNCVALKWSICNGRLSAETETKTYLALVCLGTCGCDGGKDK